MLIDQLLNKFKVCTGILLKPNYTKHGLEIVELIMITCIFIRIGLMVAIKKKYHTESYINQQGPKNLDKLWLNLVLTLLSIYSIVVVGYLDG